MSTYLNAFPGNRLAEEIDNLVQQRAAARTNRRKFLAGIGTAGAAAGTLALTAGLAGCSGGGQASITPPTGGGSTSPSVVDVLNFALNLEYLEASFYSFVTTGSGLPAADTGTSPGTVSGGAAVTFTNPIIGSAAVQLATDEREHVEFLRSTITAVGGTPVDMPNLNLAPTAPVTDDRTFLAAARQLEDTGVSAYIGGAQFLVSNANAVLYAAQILDTEAQHSGFIRELCIASGITSAALDSMDRPPTIAQIFNTDPMTGFSPVRTTSQVLQIVYAAPGQTGISSGGFFPNGMNGTIKTTM